MPKFTLPLAERRGVAEGTVGFFFDLAGRSFTFIPGQSVSVVLPELRYQDEKGNRRTFSIASSPADSHLLVATRMTGSAFKRTLGEVPPGTVVTVTGPMGEFTLPEDAGPRVVLIAGGIGITPFRSIIKDATERKAPHGITLFYANRTPEDAAFLDEMEGWARENPRIRFVPTMTKPHQSKRGWQGRTGYLDASMIREAVEDRDRATFYVAGPPAMVQGVLKILQEMGVGEDRTRVEEFSGY
ncbi:MAG: FAD-dependent oxidoreductase [Armatimonadetes bacterium]|nr:FAD-dependent oxidoreductase [Armatimonadota bacterium]